MAGEGVTVTVANQAAFDAAMSDIRKNLENLSGPLEAAGRELDHQSFPGRPPAHRPPRRLS